MGFVRFADVGETANPLSTIRNLQKLPRVLEPEIRQSTASDGYVLHSRHWQANVARPRGYVVALHGIQSHSGWYEYSSRRMCEAGFEVHAVDRRGSGLNEQQRGHAPHHDRLINDVVQFLADVRHRRNREAPLSPVILLSVSWGGKLAVVTCAQRGEQIDALALLSPGICTRIRPRPDQRLLLRLAGCLGLQHKQVPIPLDDPALFTEDSHWQQFIDEDPLTLHRASVGLLNCSLNLDRRANRAPERIRCPVLLMLAGQDRIIDNPATRRYFERIASTNRTRIEYPAAQHTLEFEPNRAQFVADLIDWLKSVCSK